MPKKTKFTDVLLELESRIETASLVSGQRLVEADLTREFGISRALLREVFRHLAAEGAIELVPNRGAEVRRLSRREALELFAIRMELEGMAARLAAERMRDYDVREAFVSATSPLLDRQHPVGALEYIAENEAFHRAIFAASGNEMLMDLARRMRLSLIMSQLREALSAEVLSTSLEEHRLIAKALLDGNPARAKTEIQSHLERAVTFITALPDAMFR